jgi:transcriptional regulator with XRE-family HTH domain
MGFRENLRSQLDYSGLMVKELAALTGIKKRTIDSYLGTHSYTPSVEAAVKIAQALGVSVEFLVTGRDTIKGRPLSSLHNDVQEIALVSERLHPQDRFIILNLARIIQKANSMNREKMPDKGFHR